MVRRCSDKMAKLLMIIFNGLFLLSGVALLIVVCMDLKRVTSVQTIISSLSGLNIVVISVGAIICLISLLGFLGALRESSCLLLAFSGLLVVILLSQVVVGYFAFHKREEIGTRIKEEAFNSLNATSNIVEESWKDIQTTFNCCGANSYKDYAIFSRDIPSQCCKKLDIGACTVNEPSFHGEGCVPRIETYMKNHYLAIGVAAIIICFIEIVGITFASCLRSAINERYETV